MRFDQPFSGLGGRKQMHRLSLFTKLEFLAPHRSIAAFLDRSTAYFARGEPTRLRADLSWRTRAGEARAATVRHDLEIYRALTSPRPTSPAAASR